MTHFTGKTYDFDPRDFDKCKATFNAVLAELEAANRENARMRSAMEWAIRNVAFLHDRQSCEAYESRLRDLLEASKGPKNE